MAATLKDIKLLWGRSANRCAICRVQLSEDKLTATEVFPFGEQAHIVAQEPSGPRGNSILTPAERDSYHNLVLLCPTHHTIIDRAPLDYPVERLHMIKAEHELWVERMLAKGPDRQTEAEDQVMADVVDATVAMCQLEQWEQWTDGALSCDPEWPSSLRYSLIQFRHKLTTALWPERASELRVATIHLSVLLETAIGEFLEFALPQGDVFVTDRYYRRAATKELYDLKADKFEQRLQRSHAAVLEATKAANWFASIVRRDLNPMFLALRGRFTANDGTSREPQDEFDPRRFEYSAVEKEQVLRIYSGLTLV